MRQSVSSCPSVRPSVRLTASVGLLPCRSAFVAASQTTSSTWVVPRRRLCPAAVDSFIALIRLLRARHDFPHYMPNFSDVNSAKGIGSAVRSAIHFRWVSATVDRFFYIDVIGICYVFTIESCRVFRRFCLLFLAFCSQNICKTYKVIIITRMWANAQRDGRPA